MATEDPEYVAALQKAVEDNAAPIGRIMINFALLDNKMDFSLMAFSGRPPYNLGAKIERLQKYFDTMAGLSTEAMPLLNEAGLMNKRRNTLVHGSITSFKAEPEPTLVFNRLDYKGKGYRHKLETLTFRQIRADAERAPDLVGELHQLVLKLHPKGKRKRRPS